MPRDCIFTIEPGFEDPKHPGKLWFCPFCNQIEGILATFPEVAAHFAVTRLPFPRPRQPVIDLIGADHQGLPVLVFADAAAAPPDAKTANGYRFVDDTRRILEIVAERSGIPAPH
ncbi:DUF3088 domain-containing protein [Chelatococcus asaccharovorans]|uniref:DUF3088 family protein n=2 Tax=Chelatococcus asaccharovorans TaxID=28210 RepID=A0A2V3U620_9HYPH|nr:DUF3088 domain-containing protein [Chelatococcus asaccharovorans]MBS7703778.1 DUF3088 domain-containing protein [Chelatococcus asaccharovorans]PXW57938.1 hypothetical protein C7450_106110 [Chelatococcus asaccharovorans]